VELEAWVTLVVLVVLVVVMVRELVTPPAAVLGALITLVLIGVADPQAALTGFSSTATATVAALFVLAAALQRHAGIERLIGERLARVRTDRGVLVRLCAPVAASSAFIANTPLVAALAPVVRGWAERTGRPASRVLMPLSFATILGGLVTTIGTSTTLVASGIVESATGRGFSITEVTPIGLPAAVLGTALLVVLAPRLLPDREPVLRDERRVYAFRMVVVEGGPLDGQSLEDAGLRNLQELFVAEIERGLAGTAPARPDSRLAGGDVLVVTGGAEHLRDLPPGLRHADDAQVTALGEDTTNLHEVVVGRNPQLVGRTLKEISFRGRYNAAVLAIDRANSTISGKLGTVPLAAGDVLLLRAAPDFVDRWRKTNEFAVVAPLDDRHGGPTDRRWLVVALTVAMVLVAALGLLSLLESVLWACALLLATRTITLRDALDSLDLEVLLIIASAIGIGATVESSGLAAAVAEGIGAVAGATSVAVALLLLLVATLLLTEVVTNVASAALVVPIALDTAEALGADPRGWAVAVAVCASASFVTPIGYQTNTIVYGLGGYRFGDFWRLGLPISLLVITVALVAVPIVWG
jgi:di/tricarboxylate transporter